MSAPTTAPRARPPIVAIAAYTLRSSLPAKRWLGIVILCAASIVFGLLVRPLGGDPAHNFAEMASRALISLLLPVTCLVVGDAVLGAEVRSGAFAVTWLSPVPTWQIAVGRWFGGSVVAAGCVSGSFALSAVVAGAAGSAGAAALSAAFGAMAYVAVFIAIGCITRRAAVWSLAFVFLIERLLGTALSGIAQLSPSWETQAAFVDFVNGPADLVREGIPHGSAALVRLSVLTAVALALASARLARLRLSGSSD